MRGMSMEMMPPESALGFVGGLKRSAALGTSKTFSRAVVVISAVAVIPGRRLRSLLSTCSTVR